MSVVYELLGQTVIKNTYERVLKAIAPLKDHEPGFQAYVLEQVAKKLTAVVNDIKAFDSLDKLIEDE